MGLENTVEEEPHHLSLNPPLPQVCRKFQKHLGNFRTARIKADRYQSVSLIIELFLHSVGVAWKTLENEIKENTGFFQNL